MNSADRLTTCSNLHCNGLPLYNKSSPYIRNILPFYSSTHSVIHSSPPIHPIWVRAEWIRDIKFIWCIAEHSWNPLKALPYSEAKYTQLHSHRSCLLHTVSTLIISLLYACGSYIPGPKQWRPVNKLKAFQKTYVGSRKGCDMMKCADSEEGIPEIGTPAKEIPGGHPFTWAQASSPPAQVDRQGQVDIIVALSLPAGPVEWKLSVFSPLQGGD